MRKLTLIPALAPALASLALAGAAPPAHADSLIGHTIKARVVALARMCRLKTGVCQDFETPADLGVYFGNRGVVFVYIGTSRGLELPVGVWSDDTQGHKVRWSVRGNQAIWEANSEQYTNTIYFSRRGSRCTARNTWRSDNPDIQLQGRGMRINSCTVFDGNVNR